MITLIARWSSTQDPIVDHPEAIFWSDGCRANYQDLLDHMGDTHELVESADGHLERHMYPFLMADVRYDGYVQMWFVLAPGQQPISLDLKYVNATDEEIVSALYDFRRVYRARIWR